MNGLRFYKAYLLLLSVVFILGCRNTPAKGKNTPAEVSTRFFTFLKNQEYDKAKALGTEQTVKIISVVQTLSEMGGGINFLQDHKKELIGCETTNNRAVCTYKTFTGTEQKVFLVKTRGKWLVDLTAEKE